jgi:hypothetical protein
MKLGSGRTPALADEGFWKMFAACVDGEDQKTWKASLILCDSPFSPTTDL